MHSRARSPRVGHVSLCMASNWLKFFPSRVNLAAFALLVTARHLPSEPPCLCSLVLELSLRLVNPQSAASSSAQRNPALCQILPSGTEDLKSEYHSRLIGAQFCLLAESATIAVSWLANYQRSWSLH